MSHYEREESIYIQDTPSHYDKSIQPWEYMESIMSEEAYKGYLQGNVIKYVSRFDDKGGLQDLIKCGHYLSKLKEHVS